MRFFAPQKSTQKSHQVSERVVASTKLLLLFKINVKVFDKIAT